MRMVVKDNGEDGREDGGKDGREDGDEEGGMKDVYMVVRMVWCGGKDGGKVRDGIVDGGEVR